MVRWSVRPSSHPLRTFLHRSTSNKPNASVPTVPIPTPGKSSTSQAVVYQNGSVPTTATSSNIPSNIPASISTTPGIIQISNCAPLTNGNTSGHVTVHNIVPHVANATGVASAAIEIRRRVSNGNISPLTCDEVKSNGSRPANDILSRNSTHISSIGTQHYLVNSPLFVPRSLLHTLTTPLSSTLGHSNTALRNGHDSYESINSSPPTLKSNALYTLPLYACKQSLSSSLGISSGKKSQSNSLFNATSLVHYGTRVHIEEPTGKIEYSQYWEDGTALPTDFEEWIHPYDKYYAFEGLDTNSTMDRPSSTFNIQNNPFNANDNTNQSNENQNSQDNGQGKSNYKGSFVALAAFAFCVDEFENQLADNDVEFPKKPLTRGSSISSWTDVSSYSSSTESTSIYPSCGDISMDIALRSVTKAKTTYGSHRKLKSNEYSSIHFNQLETLVSDDGRLTLNPHDLKSPQDWIVLTQFLSKTDFIDALRFQGVNIGEIEIGYLGRGILRKVNSISFVDTSLGGKTVILTDLIQILMQNHQLESVSFIRNSLCDDDMNIIGKLLYQPSLCRLSLSWNGIQTSGIRKLCNILLATASTITILDVSHNFHDSESLALLNIVKERYGRKLEIYSEQFQPRPNIDVVGSFNKYNSKGIKVSSLNSPKRKLIYSRLQWITNTMDSSKCKPIQLGKNPLNLSLAGMRKLGMVPVHPSTFIAHQTV